MAHFCNLRMNCIIGGVLLMIYYLLVTYLMYYEIHHSVVIVQKDTNGNYYYTVNDKGFWVLGTCFLVMAFVSLLLILGTIMKRRRLIIAFQVCQIIPELVIFYYLLVALLYGIETEFVFIYLLPFLYLIYIDVVSFIYSPEVRKILKRETEEAGDIEY